MSGTDVLFDRMIDHTRLREAVARAMSIPADRVAVIDDIANYPKRADADCVCLTTRPGGEFPMRVAIDCEDTCAAVKVQDLAVQLAVSAHSRCLVPDSSPNPYSMILITHEGVVVGRVFLEVAALDERGEFNLDPSSLE